MFDVSLPVSLAFYALVEHGVFFVIEKKRRKKKKVMHELIEAFFSSLLFSILFHLESILQKKKKKGIQAAPIWDPGKSVIYIQNIYNWKNNDKILQELMGIMTVSDFIQVLCHLWEENRESIAIQVSTTTHKNRI